MGAAGPPDDPYHGPPIKRSLPATTDDTTKKNYFMHPRRKDTVVRVYP